MLDSLSRSELRGHHTDCHMNRGYRKDAMIHPSIPVIPGHDTHVGGVARPNPAAHRDTLTGHRQPNNCLGQVRTAIPGIPPSPQPAIVASASSSQATEPWMNGSACSTTPSSATAHSTGWPTPATRSLSRARVTASGCHRTRGGIDAMT